MVCGSHIYQIFDTYKFFICCPVINRIFVIYVCICPVLIFTTGWIGRTENKLQRMLIGIGTFANFVLVSLACSQSIWKWMLETGVYSDGILFWESFIYNCIVIESGC